MRRSVPSMLDEFTFQGTWLLPVFDGGDGFGVLEFSPKTGTLVTIHGKKDYQQMKALEEALSSPQELKGILHEYLRVDLKDCSIRQRKEASLPEFTYLTLAFRTYHPAVFRQYPYKADADVWTKAEISYNALSTWLCSDPFRSPSLGEEPDCPARFSDISYDATQVCFEPIDCGEYTVEHKNFPFRSDTPEKQSISYRPVLWVTCIEPRNLDFFVNLAYHFRNLLSLLGGDPVYATHLTLYSPLSDKKPNFGHSIAHVVFPQFPATGKSHLRMFMPFNLPSLGNNLSRVFQSSIGVFSELSPIIDLFLGSHIKDDSYLSYKFSALMQALEGYHRIRFDGHYLSKEKYESLKQGLIDYYKTELPQHVRDRLIGLLDLGNQYSLKSRIENLLSRIGSDALRLIVPQGSNFAGRIVNWRNKIAHASPGWNQDAESMNKLADDYYRLHLILAALLWMELGIPQEEIGEAWKRGHAPLVRGLGKRAP